LSLNPRNWQARTANNLKCLKQISLG
jgi:hypothetical protein